MKSTIKKRIHKSAATARIGKVKEPALNTVFVSERLLQDTTNFLASFAQTRDSEGIVYWFGLESLDVSVVTTLIVPNADTGWGCISTSPASNAQVLRSIVGTPLVLIGQAHSHPHDFVRHSDIDDRQTFARFEGALSVVVPHFGRKGFNLKRCGVHRFIAGKYEFINPKDVSKHIAVLPGQFDFRS